MNFVSFLKLHLSYIYSLTASWDLYRKHLMSSHIWLMPIRKFQPINSKWIEDNLNSDCHASSTLHTELIFCIYLHNKTTTNVSAKILQICFWNITQEVTKWASLTHWGRDKMDAISQTTFSSAFSCMKMFEFRFEFHWSLFLRVQLVIFQHWFR